MLRTASRFGDGGYPDNLCTIKALLGDRYRIVEVEHGKAGVEQARTHLPDLILSDIALPGLDGIRRVAREAPGR